MPNPSVNIITVCYNAADCIRATAESVLNQTYGPLRYIVVDGGSTDGTLDVLEELRSRIDSRHTIDILVSEPDKGIYDAMNKGIALADGQWINFMNAGDRFVSDTSVADVFADSDIADDVTVVYGDTICLKSGARRLVSGWPVERIHRHQPYIHQAAFFRTADKQLLHFANDRYRLACDYDVACRIYKTHGAQAFCHVPVSVCVYNADDGASQRNKRLVEHEYLRIQLGHRMNAYRTLRHAISLMKHRLTDIITL